MRESGCEWMPSFFRSGLPIQVGKHDSEETKLDKVLMSHKVVLPGWAKVKSCAPAPPASHRG